MTSANSAVYYGACGSEYCTECRPLYDAANQLIPGTNTEGPITEALAAWLATR